jgi:hypothetical protein
MMCLRGPKHVNIVKVPAREQAFSLDGKQWKTN